MARYPEAIWHPWQYGSGAYYRGLNQPQAVVLHIMDGWISTVLSWASEGYSGASWHFSVGRDGRVFQHLEFEDGGYHAGIKLEQAVVRPPTWPLWRGPSFNVNHYTVGVEHEGFPGEPFTPAQSEASRKLCVWLAEVLRIPLDRLHFPAHADIDVVNRTRCFNTPELREQHYQFLLEDDMFTAEDRQKLEWLTQYLVGPADGDWANVVNRSKWTLEEMAEVKRRLKELEDRLAGGSGSHVHGG